MTCLILHWWCLHDQVEAEVRVSPVGLALAVGFFKWNETGSLVPNQERVCQDLGLHVLSMSSW